MQRAGELLRELRIKASMSQTEAAQALGVSHAAWGAYERGLSYVPDSAWPIVGARIPKRELDWRLDSREPRREGRRQFARVREVMDDLAAESRKRGAVTRQKIASILGKYPHMTNAAIGESLGVSDMTVSRHRRVLGLSPKRRGPPPANERGGKRQRAAAVEVPAKKKKKRRRKTS